MPCGVKAGGRKFRVKFCDFKACLFGLYFVRNFAEFQSRIYIYAPSFGSFPPRPPLVAKFSFTAFTTASRALRALVRSKKKKYRALIFFKQLVSRALFRDFCFVTLAAASLRSRKLEKSSHNTSPYLFMVKFEVKFVNFGFKFYSPRLAPRKHNF